MRHAVRSGEVFHLWANQVQSDARSSNISYADTRAYSYAQQIGEVVKNADGTILCYIVNSDARRSNTTQAHVRALRRAIPHGSTVFTIPLHESHSAQLYYLLNEITDTANKAKRARGNKPFLLSQISGMFAGAQQFAAMFELNINAAVKLKWENEILPAWLNGAAYRGYGYIDKYAYMRIVPNTPDTVETTFGACVPLSEIRAIAPRILSIFDSGKTWIAAHNITLGGYHVRGIENGVLTVGCHKFAEAEVRRFAALITRDKV